jgi:hypothetical protein
MKNLIFFFTLFSSLNLEITMFAQAKIEINGIVVSSEGAIQGARVDFYDLGNQLLENSITGTNGKFKSEKGITIGQKIKVRVSKTGYETLEKEYSVTNTGDAGRFLLQLKKLFISGFVKDSITQDPLQDAQIFFYDDQSRLIQLKSTSSMGYFDFETNFIYGQRIIVKVYKKGYLNKEQTLTITSDGVNRLDFLLPDVNSTGLKAFIRIKDKKTGKALGGALVQYLDVRKRTYVDTIVSVKGEVELKLYQKPGTILDLRISKPNYRTIKDQKILSEDPLLNVYEYALKSNQRFTLGSGLLIGGSACALVSVGMYISSNSKYESYKDFYNENRDDDYNKAKTHRTIAGVTAGVATGAFIGYVIYKIKQKKKEHALEQNTRIDFSVPSFYSYASGNTPLIGLTYHF